MRFLYLAEKYNLLRSGLSLLTSTCVSTFIKCHFYYDSINYLITNFRSYSSPVIIEKGNKEKEVHYEANPQPQRFGGRDEESIKKKSDSTIFL